MHASLTLLTIGALASASAEDVLPLVYKPTGCKSTGAAGCLGVLRVGVLDMDLAPVASANSSGVRTDTYEGGIVQYMCDTLCVTCKFVLLPDYDSRLTVLEDDGADVVVGYLVATEERGERVDYVRPFTYAGGTALYTATGSNLTDITWDEADAQGISICIVEGHYAIPQLTADYPGVDWRELTSDADINDDGCDAYVQDFAGGVPQGWVLSAGAEPLYVQPYAIATRDNDMVNLLVSGAVTRALTIPGSRGDGTPAAGGDDDVSAESDATPGPDSLLIGLEKEYLVKALGGRQPYMDALQQGLSEYVPLTAGGCVDGAGR